MDALERTLPTTRRTLGDVDLAQPLDTTHPLLDGAQGFWLPLPRHVGGSRLYDLSGRGRHGNISPTLQPNVWGERPTTSFPTTEWTGTSGEGITQPEMPDSGPFTILSWVYLLDLNNDYAVFQWKLGGGNFLLYMDAGGAGKGYRVVGGFGSTSVDNAGAVPGIWQQVAVTFDGQQVRVYTDDTLTGSYSTIQTSRGSSLEWGLQPGFGKQLKGGLIPGVLLTRAIGLGELKRWQNSFRRGFPALLNRRDSVGLLGGGGGTSPISGTFSLTDGQETISATGQTEVSGTLSVIDGSETLTLSGATIVSGAASITDAGEIISAVSSLQDITGSAQITDAGEQIDATGEVKIAGTATLNDGTEEVVIIGENDITGSLSFADLAAEIAATGSVEVQGSLALTDAEETITARERVPARLATVDVRLEDIIVVHATLEDTLTVNAKLTD